MDWATIMVGNLAVAMKVYLSKLLTKLKLAMMMPWQNVNFTGSTSLDATWRMGVKPTVSEKKSQEPRFSATTRSSAHLVQKIKIRRETTTTSLYHSYGETMTKTIMFVIMRNFHFYFSLKLAICFRFCQFVVS